MEKQLNEKSESQPNSQDETEEKCEVCDFVFDEQQFLTPKDKLGYEEEFAIIKFNDGKDSELLKYSLSNKIDDIEIAILNRTGKVVKLKNAHWKITSELSVIIKQLMKKHNVKYSMTTMRFNEKPQIIINMRSDEIWLTTGFEEFEGKYYCWNNVEIYQAIKNLINEIFPNEK